DRTLVSRRDNARPREAAASGMIIMMRRVVAALTVTAGLLVVAAYFGVFPFQMELVVVVIPAANSGQAFEVFQSDGYRVVSTSPVAADAFGDRIEVTLRRR